MGKKKVRENKSIAGQKSLLLPFRTSKIIFEHNMPVVSTLERTFLLFRSGSKPDSKIRE